MVKILKFPNRNSPASKEKMEELLKANQEFNSVSTIATKIRWGWLSTT